jgi:hypothetical protein
MGEIVTLRQAIRMLGIDKHDFRARMANDPDFPKAADGNRKRRWLADDILIYQAIRRKF